MTDGITGADVESWKETWRPMIEAVGTDLSKGLVVRGGETIEESTVGRYLEPLEFDCPLHYDRAVALQHGYSNITAPYTSILTFTIAPMWEPGRRLFDSNERNAQPAYSPINGGELRIAPEVTGFFATDFEMHFVKAPVVGDHLSRRGNVLVSCVPKWVSVGRGAFMTLESEVVTDSADVIGTVRHTVFAYEPMPARQGTEDAGKSSTESKGSEREMAFESSPIANSDVVVGKELAPVEFPLTVYRLVMAAGANRDFNSIHHNSEYAKASGASEMYANTSFLLGAWERTIRDFIGLRGTIRSIKGFRMKKFNPVGTTMTVRGYVLAISEGEQENIVEISVWCENGGETTVGPGIVTVSIPKG